MCYYLSLSLLAVDFKARVLRFDYKIRCRIVVDYRLRFVYIENTGFVSNALFFPCNIDLSIGPYAVYLQGIFCCNSCI
jgi:hypothetical protein